MSGEYTEYARARILQLLIVKESPVHPFVALPQQAVWRVGGRGGDVSSGGF